MAGFDSLQKNAKRYSSYKYTIAIFEAAFSLFLLFVFLNSGLSRAIALWLSGFSPNNFLLVPLYLLIVSFAYYCLNFPLEFYGSYSLEHRFGLSQQKIGDWFLDQLKSGIIGYVIILILLGAFYFILKTYPSAWWLVISLFWIFASLILAKLTPTIIIPIFFKYKKIDDEALRSRILQLADKMKVKLLDVFEIDFSKKTLKANAAFVGWGKNRRVLLADTLKDKYSYDEIEAILAHEFAHYRLKHLLKLLFVNSAATILIFYLIFKTNNYVLGFFGLSSLSDIAALPVIIIYFMIFGIIMQPFQCFISRRLEKNADSLALKTTGAKEAFISMMEKLAAQNLADRNPNPIIKFFFFDHPPIDERINMARSGLTD